MSRFTPSCSKPPKGPFRKKFPKHVRNPVGHIKEVGHRSGAEAFGNQHVAEKSEETGEKDGNRNAGSLTANRPDRLVAVLGRCGFVCRVHRKSVINGCGL